MPIRPENRHLYPPDWPERVAAALERAGYRCCRCQAPHLEWIQRNAADLEVWRPAEAETPAGGGWQKTIRVVLTTAHWPDPDPRNCEPWNLWILCQLHHLRLDAGQHAETAARTRRAKREALQPQLW